jgi:hypothetical protein
MTKTLRLLIFLLAISGISVNSLAQPNQAINMAYEGLEKLTYGNTRYTAHLTERLRVELVANRKFNIVQRDSIHWKRMRQELEVKDFLDEKSAVKLGNMLGAQYYLTGKIVNFLLERKENRSSTGAIESLTYKATLEASLSLINLENGKFEFSVSSHAVSEEPSEAAAVDKVISKVIAELSRTLSKKFPITAKIKAVEGNDHVIIDKGYAHGMKPHETFMLASDKNVLFRVINVNSEDARARLVAGNFNSVAVGSDIIESELEAKNQLRITKKIKNTIYLDGGINQGVKRGDTFVSKKSKTIDLGDRSVIEEDVTGSVYITESKLDYSKGKILTGYKTFQPGTVVYDTDERDTRERSRFITAGYKIGLNPFVRANQSKGDIEVNNQTGVYSINTDYNNTTEDLTTVSIITFGLGTQNLRKDLTTTLNVDLYNVGHSTLKNWISNLEVTYNHTLLPEHLYVISGGALGYGRMKQYLPNNTVAIISDGYSTYVKSNSLYASAELGIQCKLNRISLIANCSYDYLRYGNWRYDIKKDGTESVDAPADLLMYPVVELSGFYTRATLRYHFR